LLLSIVFRGAKANIFQAEPENNISMTLLHLFTVNNFYDYD